MTDSSTAAPPAPPPADDRPYSPGLEGVIAGETSLSQGRRRARPADLPRLPDRRPRRARDVPRGREPAVDRRVGSVAPPRDGPDPGRGHDRAPDAAGLDEADGRAPDRRLGVGRGQRPAVAADRRAGPGADVVLAVGAGRVRPAAGRPGAGRAGPVARPRRGLPLPAQGRAARRGHGPGARRVLHRRRGARLQRLDVHRPGHHLDPVRHRVGGRGRDRDDEGAAPRRRPVGGRRPARRRSARRSTPSSGSTTRSTAASG